MTLLETYSRELPIIKEIDALKKHIDTFRPFENTLEAKILQKLRLDWNYNSNAIEGNSFSYGETVALLMEGITVKGKPFKDAMDIKGHDTAIDLMMSIVKNERDLTEVDIKNLHKVLLIEGYYTPAVTENGLKTRKFINVGDYKESPNHVITATGETHYYATPDETPHKMRELLDWYNTTSKMENINAVVLAAFFHHRFVSIHPFDDGNGRMTRLLTNLILLKFGFPITVLKNEIKSDYYAKLALADVGEFLPFVELIANSVKDSLEIYLRAINGEDISSKSDIDKEIALFKLKLNVSPKSVLERNSALIVKIPFEIFKYISLKLNNFDYLFQKKQEIIKEKVSSSNATVLGNTLSNFEKFEEKFGKLIAKNNSVCYSYYLVEDVNNNGARISGEVVIIFSNKTYLITYKKQTLSKFYGDEILDDDLIKFVELIVRDYIQRIEPLFT